MNPRLFQPRFHEWNSAALFFVVRGRLDSELAGLVGIEPSFLPWYVVLGMVGTGIVLGTLAALLGLRRLVTV